MLQLVEDTAVDTAAVLMVVGAHMRECGWPGVGVAAKAKCPVLRFTDPRTGLACELSLNNVLALRNTDLLRAYCAIAPNLPNLIVVLKAWAKAWACHLGGCEPPLPLFAWMWMHFLRP